MTCRPPVHKDPYALAYRYHEFMKERPRRRGERPNPYYEKLLANQPDPSFDDMRPVARAIRYAKRHYECFYEFKHANLILKALNEKAREQSRNAPTATWAWQYTHKMPSSGS